MDPFTLGAMGIGTVASLIGGIANSSRQARERKHFLEDERQRARLTALRHGRWTEESTHQNWDDLYPGWVVDARLRKKQAEHQADAMDFDATRLLPFVQSATELAGGIYDYAHQPKPEPVQTESLRYYSNWRPNQAPAHMTPANPTPYTKRWFEL